MIVGEEGAGNWGCGKKICKGYNDEPWTKYDIDKIQNYNKEKIDFQCKFFKIHSETEYQKDMGFEFHGGFWNRFSSIIKLNNCSCIWNNLDKIHLLKDGKCALSKEDRDMLHNTDIHVLCQEIDILKPNIVLFCGWKDRDDAFERELPNVYEKLYDRGNDSYKGIDKYIYLVENDNVKYLFTNHPCWRRKPKDYENNIITTIKQLL